MSPIKYCYKIVFDKRIFGMLPNILYMWNFTIHITYQYLIKGTEKSCSKKKKKNLKCVNLVSKVFFFFIEPLSALHLGCGMLDKTLGNKIFDFMAMGSF